jgi:hypothetical protein
MICMTGTPIFSMARVHLPAMCLQSPTALTPDRNVRTNLPATLSQWASRPGSAEYPLQEMAQILVANWSLAQNLLGRDDFHLSPPTQ